MDNLIVSQAIAQHKPRGSLESHIEALAYFHILPEELIIAGLNDWAKRPQKDDDKIIAEAYTNGNFAQIPALMQKDTEFDPESSLTATCRLVRATAYRCPQPQLAAQNPS